MRRSVYEQSDAPTHGESDRQTLQQIRNHLNALLADFVELYRN
jgi:hypothetical protein